MDKCTYCGNDDWVSDGDELTPAFKKGAVNGKNR